MKSEVTSTRNNDGQRNRNEKRRDTFDDQAKYIDYDNGYGKDKNKNQNQNQDRNKLGNERDRTRHKGYEDPKSTGLDFAGDILEEGLELAGHAV